MDNTAQNINSQPVKPVVGPVGRVQKEAGPVIISEPIISRSDTEQEPSLHSEVSDAGVEKVTQELQFTTEHEKLGISPSFPVPQTEPSGKVKIPTDALTEEEARIIVKEGEGSNLDVQKHFEGIYYAPSVLGIALLKLKEIGKKLLLRTA